MSYNKKTVWIFNGLLTGLLFLGLIGCSEKKPEGMPKLQPVVLTVTQDGNPLPEAIVTLKPLDSSNKWSSGGTTDSNGKLVVVTHQKYKGAPLGKYKVSVSKIVGEGTPPPPTPIDEKSAKVYQDYIDSGATYEQFQVVEAQYRLVSTTPLEIEITDATQEITIEAGTAVREKIDQGRGVL
ncbi:MAG: carboxypeptidase regulatory-like domain-containing protein [Planctomycetia bacterium]|nr:carboxypeptidase regulatory-like domain-containing protein [Planctomycetia bacterium]